MPSFATGRSLLPVKIHEPASDPHSMHSRLAPEFPMQCPILFSLATLFFLSMTTWADAAEDSSGALLKQARRAANQGKIDEGIDLASKAIKADKTNKEAYSLRARLYAARRRSKQAVADFSKVIQLDPKQTNAYDGRGGEQFKLGRIKESIADFDRAIKLDPRREREHWRRGISYYYAAQYEAGQKQFEAYQKFDDNDVENAVWRYLCMARRLSPKKAAAEILKIRRDRRVPMMEVYALYSGKAKPDAVLKAAKAGDPKPAALNNRLFYAHLYLGLYYDAGGDRKQAVQHIDQAVKHKIAHYMWDVAKVHAELLRKPAKEK